MRQAGLLLSAAGPALIATATAVAQAPTIPEWTVETHISRNDYLLETPSRETYGGWDTAWRNLIRPEDLPADLRRRRLDTNTVVAIEIDAAGQARSCRVIRASSEPRLDAILCRIVTTRRRYPPRRSAPGEASTATWGVQVYWRVLERSEVEERERRITIAPPAPPPPSPDTVPYDRRWPRLEWRGLLRPVELPVLQNDYPDRPGRPAEGTTSLDLIVDPVVGITGCEIGASSGNPQLDSQACTVARAMRLTYALPCDVRCEPERLPLKFVWSRRGSHVRMPLLSEVSRIPAPIRDPADTRTDTHYRTVRRNLGSAGPQVPMPADRSHSNRFIALRFTIDETGAVRDCRITESSGNGALDAWFCQGFYGRFRYAPRTDVFGTPITEEQTIRRPVD